MLANDPAKDKAAAFLWPLLVTLWNFAADRIGEVADDAASIDRAMRAGFNWEMGPFEMWDAAGVRDTVARMKTLTRSRSAATPKRCWMPGAKRGTPSDGRACFQPLTGQMEPVPPVPGHARVADFRRCAWRGPQSNSGASLVDLGDGIGCIELHSLKNAIGGDVVGAGRRRC